jgi:hypothetical protein
VAERVGAGAAQEGDALDQFGGGLQQQQGHAGRDQQVGRPADQSAGVLRHFAAGPGVFEQRPGDLDQQQAERHEEDDDADDVDPVAHPRRQVAGDEVDAHMGVLQEGVAGAEHEHRREQVPLDFQQGVGTGVEDLAHDGVAGRDQHGGQHQPDDGAADALAELVDQAGGLEQSVHGFSCRGWIAERPEAGAAFRSGVRVIRIAFRCQSGLPRLAQNAGKP